MVTLNNASDNIQRFLQGNLRKRIIDIENDLNGVGKERLEKICSKDSIDVELFDAAMTLKNLTRQIDVIVHAVGIMLSLPYILKNDEEIIGLSLGAGKKKTVPFDLETNFRIAEFKFINWQGGSEKMRKISLFKDFYYLAEYEPHKNERNLFVLGKKYPSNFFQSETSLSSIMPRRVIWEDFKQRYPEGLNTVKEYYELQKNRVKIIDLTAIVSHFRNLGDANNK